MKIIGYYTCGNTGNAEEIQQRGKPFKSNHDPSSPDSKKFLGSGYYYWDNNKNMAHSWGVKRYQRKYYIFESILTMPSGRWLDLAGNRIDQILFGDLYSRYKKALAEGGQDYAIGDIIELLKEVDAKDDMNKGIFPYDAVRAVDNRYEAKDVNKIPFTTQNPSFTNLTPVMMVCIISSEDEIITTFDFVQEKPTPC